MSALIRRSIPQWLCQTRLPESFGRSVLLTFDDGPTPGVTGAVLDRLAAVGARAIFFVVGRRLERDPAVLRRIVDEGHWLGNHTYTHPNDRKMGYGEYRKDLQRCQDAVEAITGVRMRFHRPPWGQITPGSLVSPLTCKLTTMNWSLSSDDWSLDSEDAAVARADAMATATRPGGILLFHDERELTLTVLDRLLPVLREQGFALDRDVAPLARR